MITLSGIVIYLLILYGHVLIIRNSGTIFRKLSDIYFNYYYYGLINLTDFDTSYFLLGFHACFYLQHKTKKQHIRGTIWRTG